MTCSDTDNPRSFPVWSEAAEAAALLYPDFGRIWNWIWATCSTWPGPAAARYAGPFTAITANPVLVVGSIYDPATPYEGAVATHNLLPNSALLTVNGWGHGSAIMSQCALASEITYLIDGTVPPEGTICPADVVPFAGPPAAARAQSSTVPGPAFAGALLPEFFKQHLR